MKAAHVKRRQAMQEKNNAKLGLVNGAIGTVVSQPTEEPEIKLEDN